MFENFKMGEPKQMSIWHNLNLNLEFEFANPLQYSSIKWNCQQTSTIYIMDDLIMCLCIYFRCCPPLLMIVSITVFPRRRSHPKQKTDKPVYRQQGKQNPIDHVDKIPFPSQS